MHLTEQQQNEALKLVRILASHTECQGVQTEDETCNVRKFGRAGMCGPCQATAFLESLPKNLR